MRHTKNSYINALVKWCLKKQPKMPMERRRVRAARMAFNIYLAHKQNGVKATTEAFEYFALAVESSAETMKKIVQQLEEIRLKHQSANSIITFESTNDASVGIENQRGE